MVGPVHEAADTTVVVFRQIASEYGVSHFSGRVTPSDSIHEPHRRLEASMQLSLERGGQSWVVHDVAVCEERHHHSLDELHTNLSGKHSTEAPERTKSIVDLFGDFVYLVGP